MAGDSGRAARSGFTSPFGKLGEPFWMQLPIDIEEIHRRRASEAQLPWREYVREVMCIAAVGREQAERAAADRISAIAGKLPES
jgi:hypothetical protein